jgi:hypothetical protein
MNKVFGSRLWQCKVAMTDNPALPPEDDHPKPSFGRPMWTLAACVALIGAAVAISGSAGASPGTPSDLPPSLEELVPLISTELGVSDDQARARLSAGQEWESFADGLIGELGDRYGGAQLEYGPGGFPAAFEIYAVAPTPQDNEVVAQAGPVPVRIVRVPRSLSALEKIAAEIGPQIGGTGRIAIDFPSSSLILRPRRSLYASFSKADLDRITAPARAAGVDVSFAPDDFEFRTQNCNINVCDPPIRAGTYLQSANGVVCTSGFVAAKSGGALDDPVWIMTAGHCIQSAGNNIGWQMKTSGGSLYFIGSGGQNQFVQPAGSGPDWGLIFLNSTYTQRSNAANWVIVPGNSQHQVTGWNGPFAGETVCYTGTTSGIHCGTVTTRNASNLWETTGMPVNGGDSGSPVWDGGAARGILDGSGAHNSAYFTDVGVIWQATGASNNGAHPMTQ